MAVNGQKVLTKLISGTTFTIIDSYGLRSVSFVLISGTGSYQGALSVAGMPSDALSLTVGQPVTFAVEGNQIINDLLIDGTGGVIHLIGKN